MNSVSYHEINQNDEGQRLDNYLIRLLKGVPKSYIYRIIRGGEVRVNKKRAQVSQRLIVGDSIRVPPVRCSEKKEIFVGETVINQLQESLLFEDNDFLVFNKPAGLAVHGGSGLSLGLIEALRQSRPDLSYVELVHRLDRDTSGCILVAKKRSKLKLLQQLFAERTIEKTYWALLNFRWEGDKTVIVDQPLKKNTLKSGERMVIIDKEGKAAETQFTLLENFKNACLVEVSPKTGRTHQIRVHSAFLGHGIVGDLKYSTTGNPLPGKKRLYLHARLLQFSLGEIPHRYQANLHTDFVETLKLLRNGEDL